MPTKNVIKQIHDPNTGRIDAMLFSEFLDVKSRDMASFLGMSATGLRKNPTSDKIRPTLNRLYILVNNLRCFFDSSMSDALAWLNAPNEYLGNNTPLDCIFQKDKLTEVEELVNAMETGRLL